MSFGNLNIIDPLLRAIALEGYTTPTPIQMLAIPPLLEGRDLLGIAQTGTGKTAAFVLPILQRMSAEKRARQPGSPRVLVLAPTRELAAQIGQSFATYGKFLRFRHLVIFGGVRQGPQVSMLSQGVDILVATPGRLLDLMNQGYIDLKRVEFFVLDEIDRMLDMGFIRDVKRVVSALPEKHSSLFFSATLNGEAGEFARSLLCDPVHVEASPSASTLDSIDQQVFFVDQNSKNSLLLDLLSREDMKRVLVFARTKHRADRVAQMLAKNRIRADAIHGNKSQNQRTKTMERFRSGQIRVLVATDIAARGIDIDDITHVVNYDLPNQAESYVHRIGRTGRAGACGNAFSFCSADERSFLGDIERLTREKIEVREHKHNHSRPKAALAKKPQSPYKPHVRRVQQRSVEGSPGEQATARRIPHQAWVAC